MLNIFGFNITYFQIAATVLGIGLLVFIHELGHFIMAKLYGIRVEKFAFGFGPELIGFTYGETRYSICAIPLGGMVKMPGEDADSASGSPNEFLSQAWHRRLFLALMGPVMNYLLAVVLFASVIYFWGFSKPSDTPEIGAVVEGYPAQKAGVLKGDIIVSINGAGVSSWLQMSEIVHSNPGKPAVFEVLRGSSKIILKISPLKDPVSGKGLIGISPKLTVQKAGMADSLIYGAKITVYQSVFTLKYLGEKLIKWEKPEIAGPVGVIQILATAAKTGWDNLLYILGVISTALGLFNLLPIPLLDGGHIFMALIQAVTRRPLNKKMIIAANYAGLAVILAIFLFATYSDIVRVAFSFAAKAQ